MKLTRIVLETDKMLAEHAITMHRQALIYCESNNGQL